jgi:hypothetical protein
MKGAGKSMAVVSEPATTREFVGRVANGQFRALSGTVSEDATRLTSVALRGDRPPESGELDMRPYEASVILVHGNYEGGWIYSAEVVDAAGPLLGLIAEHVFSGAELGGGSSTGSSSLDRAVNLLVTRLEESAREVRQTLAAGYEATACRDWAAWHDRQPGGEPTLHVNGTCPLPPGDEAILKRHEPQGINPSNLLLDLEVIRAGSVGDGTQDVPVRYEEVTEFEYRTVTILPSGPTIAVEIVV